VNGAVLWQKNIVRDYNASVEFYHFATSPVVEGGRVLLNVNSAGMALDKDTGALAWTSGVGTPRTGGKYATPVPFDMNGARSALLLSDQALVAVEPATGRVLWTYDLPVILAVPLIVDPVVCGSGILVPVEIDSQGRMVDIVRQPPQTLWQSTKLRSQISTPLYIDGYVYGVDGDYAGTGNPESTLRCINAAAGAVQWEKEMKVASLAAADGKLIVLEQSGTLRIVEATPAAYTELSSCSLPRSVFDTPPVLYRGRLYCRNWHGDITCIDVRK
jgi:outer membrane protein assembly factor BamB